MVSAARWAAGITAVCLLGVPAQALELSANAAVNDRNAIGQVYAGTDLLPTPPVATAHVPEGATSLSATGVSDAVPTALAPQPDTAAQEQGGASWYGRLFHGRRTANGERYDQNEMTAAHKTLPFGTVVRVRSEVNGKEVDVRINDRGPFVSGRVIDLSQAAAKALGMLQLGVKRVTLLLPPGLRPAESRAASTGNTSATATAVAAPPRAADAPTAKAISPSIR